MTGPKRDIGPPPCNPVAAKKKAKKAARKSAKKRPRAELSAQERKVLKAWLPTLVKLPD